VLVFSRSSFLLRSSISSRNFYHPSFSCAPRKSQLWWQVASSSRPAAFPTQASRCSRVSHLTAERPCLFPLRSRCQGRCPTLTPFSARFFLHNKLWCWILPQSWFALLLVWSVDQFILPAEFVKASFLVVVRLSPSCST
jgi:hypothetical protein